MTKNFLVAAFYKFMSLPDYRDLRPTLLYQILQEYWPEFQVELASHYRHTLDRMSRCREAHGCA